MPISSNSVRSYIAVSLRPMIKQQIDIDKKLGKKIRSVLFSSSGVGKYSILKNNAVLATLFSSHSAYNVSYPFDIKVKPKDKIAVIFQNYDVATCDFYLSYELEK